MSGLNGEPTQEEVKYYKAVLAQAKNLLSLRKNDPVDDEEIRLGVIELKTLIDSDPANRFWTKIVGNPLKEGCDLLLSSGVFAGANEAIEQYMKAADIDAMIIEKASKEKNPFNQILESYRKK